MHGWLEREVKRQYQIGQYWHLIAYDWWLHWLQFTSDMSAICHFCHNSINGVQSKISSSIIDEAVVCDESFNATSIDSAIDNTLVNDNSSLGKFIILIYFKIANILFDMSMFYISFSK